MALHSISAFQRLGFSSNMWFVQPPPLPESVSPDARIPARSRRQAMDWSLVLASQAISHAVEHDEKAGWALVVAKADHEKALCQIRLYEMENRQWRWRRPVIQPGLFFDWSSLAWVCLNVLFYWWSDARPGVLTRGMMNGAAVSQGQWWRLFTATWLHAGLPHLALNMVFGFFFLGLVMGRYGPGTGLLAAYLAGAAGNVVAWRIHGAHFLGLGASGVVMGALGLLAVQSAVVLKRPNTNTIRLFAAGVMAAVLLFVLLGSSPDADVVAHAGGFISGLLLGLPLALARRKVHNPWLNFSAGILFMAFMIVPWWLALTFDS